MNQSPHSRISMQPDLRQATFGTLAPGDFFLVETRIEPRVLRLVQKVTVSGVTEGKELACFLHPLFPKAKWPTINHVASEENVLQLPHDLRVTFKFENVRFAWSQEQPTALYIVNNEPVLAAKTLNNEYGFEDTCWINLLTGELFYNSPLEDRNPHVIQWNLEIRFEDGSTAQPVLNADKNGIFKWATLP